MERSTRAVTLFAILLGAATVLQTVAPPGHTVAAPGAALAQHDVPQQQSFVVLAPVADSDVSEAFPQQNRCQATDLRIGGLFFEQQTYRHRGLLLFDVASLPPGVSILSAALRLRLLASSGGGNLDIGAYRIAAAWVPCQVTWQSQPTYAELHGSATVGTQPASTHDWDVTQLVRGWHDGSYLPRGVMLRALDESLSRRRDFYALDFGQLMPELRISYAQPTATATTTRTPTPVPSATPSRTPSPSATSTTTPTHTDTPPTPATHTPTSEPTLVPTASHTTTPTASATSTSSPSATRTRTPPAYCGADAWEPNDSPDAAAAVQLGAELGAAICPADDVDYFAVTVAKGSTLRAELVGLSADLAVSVLDPDGKLVAHSDHRDRLPEAARVQAHADGVYLLRVRAARKGGLAEQQSAGGYQLRVIRDEVRLELSPGVALPGQSLRAIGTGIQVGSGCAFDLYWNTVSPGTAVGSAVPDRNGDFDVVLLVPATASVGTHRVLGEVDCQIAQARSAARPSQALIVPAAYLEVEPRLRDRHPWELCRGLNDARRYPDLDLYPITVEVTQGVQCLDATRGDTDCADNSLPLVAGRPTIVRLYVGATGIPTDVLLPGVSAALYLRRPGEAEPGTALHTLTGGRLRVRASLPDELEIVAQRSDLERTIEFRLPPEWTTGDVLLRAQVAPDTVALCGTSESDSALENNWTADVTLHFEPRNSLRIGYVPIRYEAACWRGPSLPGDGIRGAAAWMYGMYPLAEPPEYTRFAGPEVRLSHCLSRRPPSGTERPSTFLIRDLNARLGGAYLGWLLAGLPPDRSPPDQLIGWLPDGADDDNGRSNPPYNDGIGMVLFANDTAGQRGWTMAHEIGHNLGLVHSGDDFGAVQWPYLTNAVQEIGLNVLAHELKLPTLDDFMRGGGAEATRWIAPYYWRMLFAGNLRPWDLRTGPPLAQLNSRRMFGPPSQVVESAAALVTGVIERGKSAHIEPILSVPAKPDGRWATRGGSHCLRLLAAGGTELARHCFEPAFEPEHGPPGSASFAFIVPWPAHTETVLLTHGETELAQRTAGAGAPDVALEPLMAAGPITGMQRIGWQASDPDGDPLTFTVLYRAAAGDAWQLVATELTESSTDWDTSLYPGASAARLRVVATDGIHSAQDEIDLPFSVDRKAPDVAILSPGDQAIEAPFSSVLLVGQATDSEDGRLDDARLTWTSSRDGDLGTGRQIATEYLSAGRHVIALTATDSDRMMARSQVVLWVGHRILLPAAHSGR